MPFTSSVCWSCVHWHCFAREEASYVWGKNDPIKGKMLKNKMKKVCFLFFVLSVQKKRRKKTAGLILDDIEGYCLIS